MGSKIGSYFFFLFLKRKFVNKNSLFFLLLLQRKKFAKTNEILKNFEKKTVDPFKNYLSEKKGEKNGIISFNNQYISCRKSNAPQTILSYFLSKKKGFLKSSFANQFHILNILHTN